MQLGVWYAILSGPHLLRELSCVLKRPLDPEWGLQLLPGVTHGGSSGISVCVSTATPPFLCVGALGLKSHVRVLPGSAHGLSLHSREKQVHL